MDIYENVKRLAEQKNMSVNEVERKAGMARGSIYKWSNGNPTVRSVRKVADVLGVDVDKLIK